MKTLILILALSAFAISCASRIKDHEDMRSRSLASIDDRSQNSLSEVQEASFAINEQGIKITEVVTSTLENSTPGKYTLEVDGAVVGSLISLEGTFSSDYKNGDDPITHKHVGKPKYNEATLRLGGGNTVGNHDFDGWYKKVLAGAVDRKSISVVIMNDAGEETRITFFECWPKKYIGPNLNARNSGHATEILEIAFERFEMK
jgi:phage tail-like protein